jgi:hypothetical protein
VFVWEQDVQHRVFQGPRRAEAGSAPEGPQPARPHRVYKRVTKHYAYLTCARCFGRLQRGGEIDDVHNLRVALYTAAILALGVVIIVATPVVLPALLTAFWWR